MDQTNWIPWSLCQDDKNKLEHLGVSYKEIDFGMFVDGMQTGSITWFRYTKSEQNMI